jgi:hypothetical protein
MLIGPFSPSRPVSTALSTQPISPNQPTPFHPSSRWQAGPSALRTQRVSLTPSWAGTVTQTDPFVPVRPGKPVSFPLLLAAPPTYEILAVPHAKVLRPSHCGLPRHIPSPASRCQALLSPCTTATTTAPLHYCCCTGSLRYAMDKALGAKSWVESPLPLSWCTRGRHLGRGVAFPFACLGTVRWHARVCHVATLLHPPVKLASPTTYRQNTTSHVLHTAPKLPLPRGTPSARACHAPLR